MAAVQVCDRASRTITRLADFFRGFVCLIYGELGSRWTVNHAQASRNLGREAPTESVGSKWATNAHAVRSGKQRLQDLAFIGNFVKRSGRPESERTAPAQTQIPNITMSL